MLLPRLLLSVASLSTSLAEALSQPIAVTTCRGDAVTLEAPAGFDFYAWTPAAGLDDPLARAIAVAPRTDARYTVTYEAPPGDNLVVNGGFEDGNAGFTSAYRYVPGGTFEQGTYAILTDPQTFNRGFSNCPDARGERSRMYVADGATQRGAKAWCQEVAVEPGRRYAFSLSVASLVSANPPLLAFSIDGERLGNANLPRSTCAWQRFFTIWTAPADARRVEICVVNDNETPNGNDFALDDISLRPLDPDGPRTRVYDVSVSPPRRVTLDTALCAGQRYTANGLDLVAGQSGVAELQTVGAGCDSTLTVRTTVAPPVVTSALDTANCRGATVAFDGLSLTRDTIITRVGTSSRGCDSTHVFTLRFFDRTALGTASTAPTCAGAADGAVALSITAGVAPYDVRWSNGDTDAVLSEVPAGTYQLSVRDADGCLAETEVVVDEPDAVEVLDVRPTAATCSGEASGAVGFEATGGTGALSAVAIDGLGQRRDPARLPGGEYVLRVSDEAGCFAERPFRIDAPPPIRLRLAGDTLVELGQAARFVLDASAAGLDTRWAYGAVPVDSLVDGGRLNFVPSADGLLRVAVTDEAGCTAEVSLGVRVRKARRTYFPSAFSPDGDGVNDAFGPAPTSAIARVLRLEIYDRWGGRIWSTGNCGIGDGACFWEGAVEAGGRDAGAGVYAYRAVVRLIDGREEVEVGELTVVR